MIDRNEKMTGRRADLFLYILSLRDRYIYMGRITNTVRKNKMERERLEIEMEGRGRE